MEVKHHLDFFAGVHRLAQNPEVLHILMANMKLLAHSVFYIRIGRNGDADIGEFQSHSKYYFLCKNSIFARIKNIMPKLHELFWSFFKIGTFTIGGGYAMIPLMEREIVDRRQWMDRESFMDIMAVSQAMPGIFAVNMATNVGYRMRGHRGVVVSIIGNIAMPIFIILGFATCFRFLKDNPAFEAIFKGIRPAVVALIAAPVFNMAKTAKISWRNCWIPLAAMLLIYLIGLSPVWIILSAIIGGVLYSKYLEKKEVQA